MNTHTLQERSPLMSLSLLDLFYMNGDVTDLFRLVITNQIVNDDNNPDSEDYKENKEGDDKMAMSVSQGEKYPLAVQVLPATSDYSQFVINKEDTHVDIQNNLGKSIKVHGEYSVDENTKTVMFSWDTSKYDVGSYTIVFWVSITYNETKFLIKSDTISKSIKKSSLLS